MGKVGRPTALTQELSDLICEAVRNGNYRDTAAEWVGITVRTLRSWVRRGKQEPGSAYERFLHALLEAEGAAEIKMVELVCKAAVEDPKHAEWWLERKFPQRWGSQRAEVRALQRKIAELEKQLGGVRGGAPAATAAGEDTLI